jgi:3-hydroxyacyl-[acyl-carrier-protein] dehydratase
VTGPVLARPVLAAPPSRVDGEWAAVLTLTVSPDEPVFAGHYPDFPIFPGVCLVECVRLAVVQVVPGLPAGIVGLDTIRFHGPVFPDDLVTISLRWDERSCAAQVDTGRGRAATVRMRLFRRDIP